MDRNEIIEMYMTYGFKALRCAGYNSGYNQEQDTEKKYKRAKEAVDKGFTEKNFQGLTVPKIEAWEKAGGWIGWLIPRDCIAIDVEDPEAISHIENLCKEKGIKPLVHCTNHGKHFFFRIDKDLSAASTVYTKSGVKVTYRVGSKNYLILAPTNGRRWQE